MPQNYEDLLDLTITPVQFLAPSMDKERVTKARQYLGAMRYTTDEMEHAVRDLSGGQKAKLLLLKMNYMVLHQEQFIKFLIYLKTLNVVVQNGN